MKSIVMLPMAIVALAFVCAVPRSEAQVIPEVDAVSVRIAVLPGWVRADVDGRAVFVPPEDPESDLAMLSVEPGVQVPADFDMWFGRAWHTFVGGHGGVQIAAPVFAATAQAGHAFRLVMGSMEDGLGGYIFFLYFAGWQPSRAQPIVFASRDQDLFNQYLEPVAIPLQTAVTFLPSHRQPAPAAHTLAATDLFATGPTIDVAAPPRESRGQRVWGTPGGSPLGPPVPGALDGIYTGFSKRLRRNIVVGVPLSKSPVGIEDLEFNIVRIFVTFYPDGRVYRQVPEGGLEGFDRDSAERHAPDLWGRYRQVAPGKWEIQWNGSGRLGSVTREGNGLRYEDGLVVAVPACREQALVGTFTLATADASFPWRITFQRDGRFRDESLIGTLAYENFAIASSRTIDAGVGRYRLGRHTLYLNYDDGRTVIVALHCQLGEVEPAITTIWINGRDLKRL